MKLNDILREQDIMLKIPAKGRRSALAGLAAELGKRVEKEGRVILTALLRRERLGSTGVGGGVAIPHALLSDVHTPASVLATLREPVVFDAPDGIPIDLLLGLLWPRSDAVGLLRGLAVVCRNLRHPELRARLRASETAAEAHAWIGHFDASADGPQSRGPQVNHELSSFVTRPGRNANDRLSASVAGA